MCLPTTQALKSMHSTELPAFYSARYAGPGKSPDDNITKLLKQLDGISLRKARFITVIALIFNKKEHLFEGTIEGEILNNSLEFGGIDSILDVDLCLKLNSLKLLKKRSLNQKF